MENIVLVMTRQLYDFLCHISKSSFPFLPEPSYLSKYDLFRSIHITLNTPAF